MTEDMKTQYCMDWVHNNREMLQLGELGIPTIGEEEPVFVLGYFLPLSHQGVQYHTCKMSSKLMQRI